MTSRKSVLTAGPVFAVGVVLLGGFVATAADGPGSPRTAVRGLSDPPRLSAADRLVRQALAAELAGDNARRDKLLSEALKEDPNCRSARWQSGFISSDGKWQMPDEAQQQFSGDQNLAEYRRRRAEAAKNGLYARGVRVEQFKTRRSVPNDGMRLPLSSVPVESAQTDALLPEGIAANIELARWCDAQRLTDEARAHWTQTLIEQPGNAEAASRLGLRRFRGGFYTDAEISDIKRRRTSEEKAFSDWKPTVLRWRSALNEASEPLRKQAAREMHDLSDASVIPALEWASVFDVAKAPASRGAASRFQREAIALLGRIPTQRAVDSLIGHSLFARQEDLRAAAARELRNRKLHDFVPILLAGMANPIVLRQSVIDSGSVSGVERGAFITEHDALITQQQREKEAAAWYSDITVSAAGLSRLAQATADRVELRRTQALANFVGRENERIESMNKRIDAVLRVATGQFDAGTTSDGESEVITVPEVATSVDSAASFWWAWWDQYNETYASDRKLVQVVRHVMKMKMSCFSAGTKVIAAAGGIPIEKLEIGDRVLAQDADTGELAFKPVLGTTVRPPVEMVLITTTRGDLRTTRGHPFWIVGKGWRMAKELEVGDRVVRLGGSATVTALDTLPPEPAYNLIVADFGTYFVGGGRILVHDNTPRLPTPVAIPGYLADAR
jgi:hypothetical protein